jgi:hypothetical protein
MKSKVIDDDCFERVNWIELLRIVVRGGFGFHGVFVLLF